MSSFLQAFKDKPGHVHTDKGLIENKKGYYFEETKDVVIETEESLTLPTSQGSFVETLEFFLENVKKGNSSLTINKEFGYNITYASNLLTTYSKPTLVGMKGPKEKYELEFNLIQPELIIYTNKTSIPEIREVVTVNNIIMGISKKDKSFKVLSFFNGDIREHKLSEVLQEKEKKMNLDIRQFAQLLIDSGEEKEERHILLSDVDGTVLIFKVVPNTNTSNEKPRIYLSLVTKYDEIRLPKNKLVDFVFNKGAFYIGHEKGLVVRDLKEELKFFDTVMSLINVTSFDLLVNDFQKVGNNLFVLVKNYGIKIMDIANPKSLKWLDFDLNHPHLVKMSLHYNPYYKYPFLGVLANHHKTPEFFFELSLENPANPLLYRFYLSDKSFKTSELQSDDKYTYIFEENSNSLLVLSRSTTAHGKNSIYKFQIPEFAYRDITNPIIQFTDETYVYKSVGLIAGDVLVYVDDVEMINASLEINVRNTGQYQLDFYSFSDYCNSSRDLVLKCKLHASYKITAYNGFSITAWLVTKVTLSVIIVIVILITVIIVFNFRRIKNWIQKRNYVASYADDEKSQRTQKEVPENTPVTTIGLAENKPTEA